MSYNELTNQGNVKWSQAAGGGIRLDVDPLASLILAAIDAAEVKEGGQRIVGEVGSNVNGSWVRFGNGLQVCWFQSATDTPTNQQTVAPWWHTEVATFAFPQSFVATPTVVPTNRASSHGLGVIVTGGSSGSVGLRGFGVNNAQSIRFGYVAFGRWK